MAEHHAPHTGMPQGRVDSRATTGSGRTGTVVGYEADPEVLEATGKSAVKEALGRSPDHLDAAAMAVWARDRARGAARSAEDIVVL